MFYHKIFLRRLIQVRKDHQSKSANENDLDPDEGNTNLCRACSLPIFSTPYEKEESGNFLHKCCTNLPDKLMEHVLHLGKPFHLQKELPSDLHGATCSNCYRKCGGFFYRCPNSECGFILDVLCAITVKILHRSHKHELVAICRKALTFACGACGLEHKGEFYWCNLCNFYLHQDCALLPNAILLNQHDSAQDSTDEQQQNLTQHVMNLDIEHKQYDLLDEQKHHLTLAYRPAKMSLKFLKRNDCSICRGNLPSKSGVYFCLKCEYAAHIKCAMSEPDNFHQVLIRDAASGLIHLPMPNEHTSLMCRLLEKDSQNTISKGLDTFQEGQKILKEGIHDHHLIFHEKYYDSSSESSFYLCNACTQPISSPPFYSCPQCSDFCLHTWCANLPLKNRNLAHEISSNSCEGQPLLLSSGASGSFSSSFWCRGCNRECNGFMYSCNKCSFKLDAGCAFLPQVITHEAHGKSHILFLSLFPYLPTNKCYCCGKRIYGLGYECCSCLNFQLHAQCALLPSKVSHKYDRHLLKLTSPEFSTYKVSGEDYCEICENPMDNKSWFYHCEGCITSFHVKCIPCVANLSKIKFGGTIHVMWHRCPLTSICCLTSYSYTCGLCKKTIQGGMDGIAFECIKCCYWLHYECARKLCVKD